LAKTLILPELTNPALYTVGSYRKKAWFKIKGKNKLTGKQVCQSFKTLAQWREKTAQAEDRPKSGYCVMNCCLI